MIPLNAQEAAELLRHRRREIAQSERQVAYFEALAANERARLDRFKLEAALLTALQSQTPGPTGASNEGGGHVG